MNTRVNRVSKKSLKVGVCKCGFKNRPVRTMHEFASCGGCFRTVKLVPYIRENPRYRM